MDTKRPSLTEPGVKYFLRETLKKCRDKKYKFFSFVFNLVMFVAFVGLFGGILYYKYKGKLTIEEKQKRNLKQQEWIMEKIKTHKKPESKLITNLPTFKDNTEIMHRNFYNR